MKWMNEWRDEWIMDRYVEMDQVEHKKMWVRMMMMRKHAEWMNGLVRSINEWMNCKVYTFLDVFKFSDCCLKEKSLLLRKNYYSILSDVDHELTDWVKIWMSMKVEVDYI